ncbi:helix-turn-helix domain-containing protein [Streptomyces sp. NPDC054813]
MAYGHKTPHQARQRASVVLLAARGLGNARIAAETQLHVDTVRTWRGRFAHGGLPALADRKRSGRPARFTQGRPHQAGLQPPTTGRAICAASLARIAFVRSMRSPSSLLRGPSRRRYVSRAYDVRR